MLLVEFPTVKKKLMQRCTFASLFESVILVSLPNLCNVIIYYKDIVVGMKLLFA